MKNDLLKRTRYYKGFKQYQMADEIGVSRQTYNYKENGRLEFNAQEIINISNVLKLTLPEVNDIFFNGELSK